MQPKLIDTLTGQSRPICVDCGEPYERTAQEIAARRGTGLGPSPRCPACRIARREERNARVLETLRNGALRETRSPAVGPAGCRRAPLPGGLLRVPASNSSAVQTSSRPSGLLPLLPRRPKRPLTLGGQFIVSEIPRALERHRCSFNALRMVVRQQSPRRTPARRW